MRKSSTFVRQFSIFLLGAVQILRGQTISFRPSVFIPHAGNLSAGDFNGDAKTDLLFFDGQPGILCDYGKVTSVSVAIGNGDGTFQPSRQTRIPNGLGIKAAATGDFNLDGKSDLAMLVPISDPTNFCGSKGTNLQIFLGSPSGDLQPGQTVPLPDNVTGLYVGDFNGDGKADLVTFTLGFNDPYHMNAPSFVRVLLGNGDGTFTPSVDTVFTPLLPLLYGFALIADVNRDTKADIFFGPNLFLSNGDGTFKVTEISTSPVLFLADLNHDGNPDIVRLDFQNNHATLLISLGNGHGAFASDIRIPLPFSPSYFVTGDFNGDGYPDLAIAAGHVGPDYPYPPLDENGIAVILSKADGTFEAPMISAGSASSPLISAQRQFLATDFNHDGKLDLLAGNTLLAGNGDGTFRAPIYLMSPPSPLGCNAEIDLPYIPCIFAVATAVAADFNNDGLSDLALSFSNSGVFDSLDFTTSILINDSPGSGFLSTGVSSATRTAPVGHQSLVSAYGVDLAPATEVAPPGMFPTTLGGIRLHLRDSTGLDLLAPLLYVSPAQINYVVPKGLSDYLVAVSIERIGEPFIEGATALRLEPTVPGLFALNDAGLAAASAIRVNADGSRENVPVFSCSSNGCVAIPIDVSRGAVYLSLYGTGFTEQFISEAIAAFVSCNVNANTLPDATYAGPQIQIPGLDQINLLLPTTLAGSGDSTLSCFFLAGFSTTNSVRITIQ